MTTPVTEARRAEIFALAVQRSGDPAARELAAAVPELLDALDRAQRGFVKAIGERDEARAEVEVLAEVAVNLELLLAVERGAAQLGGAP